MQFLKPSKGNIFFALLLTLCFVPFLSIFIPCPGGALQETAFESPILICGYEEIMLPPVYLWHVLRVDYPSYGTETLLHPHVQYIYLMFGLLFCYLFACISIAIVHRLKSGKKTENAKRLLRSPSRSD